MAISTTPPNYGALFQGIIGQKLQGERAANQQNMIAAQFAERMQHDNQRMQLQKQQTDANIAQQKALLPLKQKALELDQMRTMASIRKMNNDANSAIQQQKKSEQLGNLLGQAYQDFNKAESSEQAFDVMQKYSPYMGDKDFRIAMGQGYNQTLTQGNVQESKEIQARRNRQFEAQENRQLTRQADAEDWFFKSNRSPEDIISVDENGQEFNDSRKLMSLYRQAEGEKSAQERRVASAKMDDQQAAAFRANLAEFGKIDKDDKEGIKAGKQKLMAAASGLSAGKQLAFNNLVNGFTNANAKVTQKEKERADFMEDKGILGLQKNKHKSSIETLTNEIAQAEKEKKVAQKNMNKLLGVDLAAEEAVAETPAEDEAIKASGEIIDEGIKVAGAVREIDYKNPAKSFAEISKDMAASNKLKESKGEELDRVVVMLPDGGLVKMLPGETTPFLNKLRRDFNDDRHFESVTVGGTSALDILRK